MTIQEIAQEIILHFENDIPKQQGWHPGDVELTEDVHDQIDKWMDASLFSDDDCSLVRANIVSALMKY